ncbi:hypothetical protein BH20ACT24_BH20ACT24_09720 [soil metagenome]
MGAGHLTDVGSKHVPPVSLRTRFERFPATIKGAFVLQGADGNPHAIELRSVRVARVPVGPERPVPSPVVAVNVAPGRDLFVPFEASIADLSPGWYEVRSSIQVDGARSYEYGSRAFSVPWPRADVRRGTIRVGALLRVGDRGFRVERVELGRDAATVVWRPQETPEVREAAAPAAAGGNEHAFPPEPEACAVLVADGEALESLPAAGPEASARPSRPERRSVAYPVPSSAASLSVLMRLPSGESSDPAAIDLP